MGRNKETMKRVLKFISPYKAKIIIMLLTALVTVGFTLYTPILIGNGVDNIVGPGNVNTAGLLKVLGALAVIVVGNAVSQWVMNLLTNQVTYSVVQDVRSQAFTHLQEVPVSYIDANQPGDILSRIVSDVSQFSDGLLMGFTQLFTGVLTIFGTIGFMLSISVKITVIDFPVRGKLYRRQNLPHVSGAVREESGDDFYCGRACWKSEDRAGFFL